MSDLFDKPYAVPKHMRGDKPPWETHLFDPSINYANKHKPPEAELDENALKALIIFGICPLPFVLLFAGVFLTGGGCFLLPLLFLIVGEILWYSMVWVKMRYPGWC